MPETAMPATATSAESSDRLQRFLLPDAGVRGVHVSLSDTWRQIRDRSHYPPSIAELLGEAAAAAALLTGHAKVDGRLSIQLRGHGALRTLFVECTAAGTLRGIAQLAEDADASAAARDLRELGPDAILAITIENPGLRGGDPVRYQGLVPIQSDSLGGALEDYFRQSEQLPTRLLLAANGDRAAGLMLQKLPGDEGDADGWTRVGALFDTLHGPELLASAGQSLLHRLFHEEAPQLTATRGLSFACSCSRERVAGMLQALGAEEAHAAVIGGHAEIRCEFCGQTYHFSPVEVEALFAPGTVHSGAPERLQ